MSDTVAAVEKKDCSGCGACFNVCPVGAVEMKADEEGFLYPCIDTERCVNCGLCVKTCPACGKVKVNTGKTAYAAYAKDEEEHKASSSGGIFAVLAGYVLGNGGYICGAAFDEEMYLSHLVTDKKEDLLRIRETKYVQSDTDGAYRKIEKLLDEGKSVLFCGTPCQAAGLCSFLGKDYENLLVMDLICHGVPSPQAFAKHLEETGNGQKVIRMSFRDKSEGMNHILLKYELEDGRTLSESYEESAYIKGFLQNLTVRPSCFACRFKGTDRASDITIGDFWGLNDYHPEMVSPLGTSAVLAHSEKGVRWLEEVKDELEMCEASPEEVSFWNSCLLKSVEPSIHREAFFREYRENGFHETVEKYYVQPAVQKSSSSLGSRLKRKAKHLLSSAGIKK